MCTRHAHGTRSYTQVPHSDTENERELATDYLTSTAKVGLQSKLGFAPYNYHILNSCMCERGYLSLWLRSYEIVNYTGPSSVRVCACVWMCACTRVCRCMHMGSCQKTILGCLLDATHLVLWERASHWSGVHQVGYKSKPVSPQDLPVSTSPALVL